MRRETVEVPPWQPASGLEYGGGVRQAMLVAPCIWNINEFLMTVQD